MYIFQPPEGIKSVGEHINLEISIYLQRFPHHQRTLRRLIFDYLLKRECCITGCDNMNDVDLIGKGISIDFSILDGNCLKVN